MQFKILLVPILCVVYTVARGSPIVGGSPIEGAIERNDDTSETVQTSDVDSTDPSETTEPTTTTIQAETTSTSASVPKFSCTSVGRFPYPDSCAKYYYCWDTLNNHAIFSCPKVFHPETKRCVENYSVCASAPNCTYDKQVLANPDDRYSFFECNLNKNSDPYVYEIRRGECEKGREFDEQLGFCKLVSDEWASSENHSEWFECSTVGIFIDFSSDTHYVQCVVKSISKGILRPCRHKCPANSIFNGIDMKCQELK
ncbi:uncharacterized protein LOC116338165 [Contarinia nasturtii]|uniref:uncharacterized protein LOC116338165 n=1 Tax=Contarinia nasturtii TaxID=265458 RepID=UPI0012D4C22E|nr:uncharacterized protein LOC116338165 [Contarinia nasturtii]